MLVHGIIRSVCTLQMMKTPHSLQIEVIIAKGNALWPDNVKATYQRLANKMFADLIGKILGVYVDDMLMKSIKTVNHVKHLTWLFQSERDWVPSNVPLVLSLESF